MKQSNLIIAVFFVVVVGFLQCFVPTSHRLWFVFRSKCFRTENFKNTIVHRLIQHSNMHTPLLLEDHDKNDQQTKSRFAVFAGGIITGVTVTGVVVYKLSRFTDPFPELALAETAKHDDYEVPDLSHIPHNCVKIEEENCVFLRDDSEETKKSCHTVAKWGCDIYKHCSLEHTKKHCKDLKGAELQACQDQAFTICSVQTEQPPLPKKPDFQTDKSDKTSDDHVLAPLFKKDSCHDLEFHACMKIQDDDEVCETAAKTSCDLYASP